MYYSTCTGDGTMYGKMIYTFVVYSYHSYTPSKRQRKTPFARLYLTIKHALRMCILVFLLGCHVSVLQTTKRPKKCFSLCFCYGGKVSVINSDVYPYGFKQFCSLKNIEQSRNWHKTVS